MRYLTPLLFAAAATVLNPAPAYADLGDQLFKLLPDDGAAEDFFGHSVAISGTTAIVGAAFGSDNFRVSGSAYLFDISDPANPAQLFKLLPEGGGADFDFFAWHVAIDGTTAVVAALGDDDNGENAGAAYHFDTTTGNQLFKLLANDGAAGDQFGQAVAISGTTAIAGAIVDDDNGELSGSAYLFDITTGQQLFKLLPDDGAGNDLFGVSVAINGTTAIVGALGDDDNAIDSGSAYLFDITTGKQLFKLLPDDGAAGDTFGTSVAISPNAVGIAIVGARRDDDNGIDSGSAYLFDIATGKQLFKLLPDDGATVDFFGRSVAISPDSIGIAIVGAIWDDDNGNNSGSAYLFDAAAAGKCPWDLDGSGSVGAADLLTLLASWGSCKGCPPTSTTTATSARPISSPSSPTGDRVRRREALGTWHLALGKAVAIPARA